MRVGPRWLQEGEDISSECSSQFGQLYSRQSEYAIQEASLTGIHI